MDTAPSPEAFILHRTFDAPPETVFNAWTEAEALAQWWGPQGMDLFISHLDARPGGYFHYCMTMPGGGEMWGKFVYREITSPERLVFINSFADAEGNVTKCPFPIDLPLENLNTVTFTEEGGKTHLHITVEPQTDNPDQRKAFADLNPSMQKGYAGTLDQLDEFLAKK